MEPALWLCSFLAKWLPLHCSVFKDPMPFTHVSFRFSQSLHRDDLISLPSIDVVVNIFFKTFFRSVSASSEVFGFGYCFRFISNTEPYENVLPIDDSLAPAVKPVFVCLVAVTYISYLISSNPSTLFWNFFWSYTNGHLTIKRCSSVNDRRTLKKFVSYYTINSI